MVGEMCEISADRQRIYGASAEGEMVEVDEYGRAPGQRATPGSTVGFPMQLFQYNLGWTRKYLETATPADLAIRIQAAEKAHLRRIQKSIRSALFLSANYTFVDHLVDKVSLSVKRLVNADGAAIPDGPNGETFSGATHSHYVTGAGANMTQAEWLAFINTVVEHGFGGQVKLAINRANESAFKTVWGTAFNAYIDPRVVPAQDTSRGAGMLNISRIDNRAIGVLAAAEVWVKPWVPSGYAFVWDAASPQKPLVFRQRSQAALQGLRIAAELETHPLHAQFMEAEFGVGVWTRTNGACAFDTGKGTWTDPTL